MKLRQQVSNDHYLFLRYVNQSRWMSYFYQIKEILSHSDVNSVLEIGPGSEMLRNVLARQSPAIDYMSLDIAEDLSPDIVGSCTSIPVADDSFDLVAAFQVLEHIPYEQVPLALKEIARVSQRHVILSLPHFGPSFRLHCNFHHFSLFRFALKFPYPKKHVFDGEHHWEIGKRGFSSRKIRSLLSNFFYIEKEYLPFENQYHRFFVLTPR